MGWGLRGECPSPSQATWLELELTDPPTQADGQAIIDKLNELITALHRTVWETQKAKP